MVLFPCRLHPPIRFTEMHMLPGLGRQLDACMNVQELSILMTLVIGIRLLRGLLWWLPWPL